MSDAGTGNGVDGQESGAPRMQVIGQYIKDLSFENPGVPANMANRPQIELAVDLQVKQMDNDHFEVELKLRVSAMSEGRSMFLLELLYGGLFLLQNIPAEVRQQVLLVDAPHIIFPFARRIVADVVRDGGMPPLLIEPIDFASLYRSRQGEMAQMRQGSENPIV